MSKNNLKLFLTATLLLSSCAPYPGPDKTISSGILTAGWGAGAGMIIGHQTGALGHGAAVGAGFGAVAGLLIGASLDLMESAQLTELREITALKSQVAYNRQALMTLQDTFDEREDLIRDSINKQEVILFSSGSDDLELGAVERLQRYVNIIKQNPYVNKIYIYGHADDLGNSQKNIELGESRANSVKSLLVNNGISSEIIETKSFGSSRPYLSNSNNLNRQQNRRVEIFVIG